jgi:hypothetical protein
MTKLEQEMACSLALLYLACLEANRKADKREGWIPAAKRLPEGQDAYLVHWDGGMIRLLEWWDAIGRWDWDGIDPDYWMPLPDPPTSLPTDGEHQGAYEEDKGR